MSKDKSHIRGHRTTGRHNSQLSTLLLRLAWILQHAATLLPMVGDIQAVLNSHTAGVSDIPCMGIDAPV